MKASARLKKPMAPPAHIDLEGRRIELARARVVARAWSETVPESRRTSQAALFSRAAIEAFAAVIVPDLALSAPFVTPRGKLDATARQLAVSIGREAAPLPML